MSARFFGFEQDFVDGLRCIPMCVRLKLDLCGIKLSLAEWSRLNAEERRALAGMPAGTESEKDAFAARLSGLVARRSGHPPKRFPPVTAPAWENAAGWPEQILAKAADESLALDDGAWSRLDALERFALIKLSRPGHENRNFKPALREFGLLESQ